MSCGYWLLQQWGLFKPWLNDGHCVWLGVHIFHVQQSWTWNVQWMMVMEIMVSREGPLVELAVRCAFSCPARYSHISVGYHFSLICTDLKEHGTSIFFHRFFTLHLDSHVNTVCTVCFCVLWHWYQFRWPF